MRCRGFARNTPGASVCLLRCRSRLVRQLLTDFGPQAVVCLVKPPVTPLEANALESFRTSGLRLIQGELMQPAVADEPAPKVDIVFHLAANIDTDASEDELRVNHIGTGHLLDWLKRTASGARIIYASSVAVHDRDRKPAGPIDESSPLVPRTAYFELAWEWTGSFALAPLVNADRH